MLLASLTLGAYLFADGHADVLRSQRSLDKLVNSTVDLALDVQDVVSRLGNSRFLVG